VGSCSVSGLDNSGQKWSLKKGDRFGHTGVAAEGGEPAADCQATEHQPKHREKVRREPGYPARDRREISQKSLLDLFQGNIAAWVEEDMGYKATWIYDHLSPMGFSGSYEIGKRAVHEIKKERQQIVYMRFETEPG
jgi:hypothetical protein